jgi:ferrous iron transport protein A
VTLDQLAPGETATVEGIDERSRVRRRLLELGLVSGTHIRREGAAPLGDPLTFRVRGAVLALRRSDALFVRIARA